MDNVQCNGPTQLSQGPAVLMQVDVHTTRNKNTRTVTRTKILIYDQTVECHESPRCEKHAVEYWLFALIFPDPHRTRQILPLSQLVDSGSPLPTDRARAPDRLPRLQGGVGVHTMCKWQWGAGMAVGGGRGHLCSTPRGHPLRRYCPCAALAYLPRSGCPCG